MTGVQTCALPISYGYNDRSEVTSAVSANNATYNFGFNFDQIGNRKTYDTTESGSNVQSVYATNVLNQYTSISKGGIPYPPTYDDDGDMLTMTLNSGSWTNTYNAENRLITAVNGTTTLEFKYDYMGRRVEKKVIENGTTTKDEYFVYDGYKQIENLDALNSSAILSKNIWQGERLLSVLQSVGPSVLYALQDANKNITEYIDSTGAIQAHYEYSPFGKITQQSGSGASDFDFRFSSEYQDTETGLTYYNYRYYSPELGRWLSRDPIEEDGGYNLYGMVGNNVLILVDVDRKSVV